MITGFAAKKESLKPDHVYDTVADLYNVTDLKALSASQAMLDYVDTAEAEGSLIPLPIKAFSILRIAFTICFSSKGTSDAL